MSAKSDDGVIEVDTGPSEQPEMPPAPARHSKYYFDDQQSVFLVRLL